MTVESTAARPVAPPWLALGITFTAFDALATLLWLELGVAQEGNPLLRPLVEQLGPVPAMGLRLLVGVGLLVALAALAERSRIAGRALPAVTVALASVALWHLVGGLSAI